MLEHCDHNRFFVEHRVREIEKFEARARGDNTAAIAAKVATQLGAEPMNYHQTDTLSRPNVSLLQPAVSSSAFLKAGILGFQGGGKTLTSAKCLIGLYKYTQELGLNDGTKPVAMFDTEKGSDWLIPIFKAAGVPFVVAKRKSFSDLLTVMKESEQGAFGLLIDSITHPWRELVEAYLRKKERSYLTMDDWGYLKGEHGWQQFTDIYVNSKLHIVMAGRAGFEYENYIEDGRKKMEKVGTKMKTEGETGYEPDLLILMEQVEDLRTGKVVHRATVQKDRSTLLDGVQFDNPDFADFLPHVKSLSLGGNHVGVGTTGDSQHLLKVERRDWTPTQRRILIDKIQTHMQLKYPGQTAADKTGKLRLMLDHFNTVWAEIEEAMPLPDLKAGYDSMHRALYDGKPSEYASATAKDEQSNEIHDSLPAFATLGQVTEKVTETLVPIAVVDTETLSPNGMPAFLDRTKQSPAAPDVDEAKWLAELTKAFEACLDFAAFGEKQQTLMAPFQAKVAAETYKKAKKLAAKYALRFIEAQSGPGGAAVAAE